MGIFDKKYKCLQCEKKIRTKGDWGYCDTCRFRYNLNKHFDKKYLCPKCKRPLSITEGIGYCDICDIKYNMSPATNTSLPSVVINNKNDLPANPITSTGVGHKSIIFPDWYVSVSFAKSKSENYPMAVALAKSAPQYHEQEDNGRILHQAIYSSKPQEYLEFIRLYELVGNWKSSFVFINGKMIDRKIIAKLNYCYGDNCRSGNPNFCFGASYMTENPFGCHRFQISACNHPWWSFYTMQNNGKWILDKQSIKQQINSYTDIYNICPLFDYGYAIRVLDALPTVITDYQMQQLRNSTLKINL